MVVVNIAQQSCVNLDYRGMPFETCLVPNGLARSLVSNTHAQRIGRIPDIS